MGDGHGRPAFSIQLRILIKYAMLFKSIGLLVYDGTARMRLVYYTGIYRGRSLTLSVKRRKQQRIRYYIFFLVINKGTATKWRLFVSGQKITNILFLNVPR